MDPDWFWGSFRRFKVDGDGLMYAATFYNPEGYDFYEVLICE